MFESQKLIFFSGISCQPYQQPRKKEFGDQIHFLVMPLLYYRERSAPSVKKVVDDDHRINMLLVASLANGVTPFFGLFFMKKQAVVCRTTSILASSAFEICQAMPYSKQAFGLVCVVGTLPSFLHARGHKKKSKRHWHKVLLQTRFFFFGDISKKLLLHCLVLI